MEPQVDNVLKVIGVDWDKLNLDPELVAKLSIPVKTVESDKHRTVFLSFHFDSSLTEDEVKAKAINKFLVPDLTTLHWMEAGLAPAPDGFKILGCLAPPSIIKLTGPAVVKFVREWPNSTDLEYYKALGECIEKNRDVPPFTYAVFCFVSVAYSEPLCRLDDREFRRRLEVGGLECQQEGEVGPKVVLED